MNDEPEGREIGSKVSPNDQITVGVLSGTVAVILQKQEEDATHVPGYTWVQELNEDGIVVASPHMGPPVRMTIYQANEFFEFT